MSWIRLLGRLVILGLLAIVGGACSIMPTSGPEIGEIHRGGNPRIRNVSLTRSFA